jgi:hypothetical protein
LIRDGVPPAGVPVDDIIDNAPLVFREGSREAETTVKYDLTTYLPMQLKLQAGGSVKIFQLDYETASPFGSDTPFSTGDLVNPFELSRAFTTSQSGGYVQTTRDIGSRVNATVGLRADRFQYLGATRVAPRAAAGVRLTDEWSLRGSYGQFFQQPPFLFLAAFPANANLDPLRADHYVAGVTYTPDASTRVSIEAYRKVYRDYPVSSDFPALSLANVGDTFNVRDVLFPMVSEGRGRASGVELLAERKPGGRWYGQANLSFSRARHAGQDGVYRPGSYDYPIILNADAAYQVSDAWQVSGRLAWLGGRPFTPFDEVRSLLAGRGVFDLARVNAERTPDYFRLDVRVERAFAASGERPLFVFFGVQNVTNRKNVAGYDWNRRLGETRLQEQMGIFPILGLEWRF